jgi:hypothetical protein
MKLILLKNKDLIIKMYNIYTEKKKKKELENQQKEELKKLKYKEKFQSK